MSKMIFINLPVSDLDASTRFYEALGATKNPQFSNENAACMMLTDTIGVMILTHDYYGTFTKRPIADAKATSQVTVKCCTLLSLSQPKKNKPTKVDSRKNAIRPSMAKGAPKISPT